jgi:hypothetical protein
LDLPITTWLYKGKKIYFFAPQLPSFFAPQLPSIFFFAPQLPSFFAPQLPSFFAPQLPSFFAPQLPSADLPCIAESAPFAENGEPLQATNAVLARITVPNERAMERLLVCIMNTPFV